MAKFEADHPRRRTYGPAFRVLAMGETRIFVTSPALINHVYKNSKSLYVPKSHLVSEGVIDVNPSDFSYFRKHMQSFIFGMARKSAFAQVVEDRLFEDHHRAMQPGAIAGSIKRYADLLEMRLRGRADDLDEKKEVDGVEAVYDIASCGDWEERNGALETDLVDFVFDIMVRTCVSPG